MKTSLLKAKVMLSRFRLLSNIIVLAACLCALAASPAPVSAVGDPICEGGCVDWNAQQGCVRYQYCCVYDNGNFCCIYS